MKKRFLLVASCLLAALRAEPATAPAVAPAPETEAPQFIRVEEKEAATELQTAVVKFTKGDASVELVGAIHIADQKYYEALNKRFEGYEAVLYEGIGGGQPAPAAVEEEADKAAPVEEEKDAAAAEEGEAAIPEEDPEDRERTIEERLADIDAYVANPEAAAKEP